MPFSTQEEIKISIFNYISQLIETYKESLGSYIYLLQNPTNVSEYLFPVGQLVQRQFALIHPRVNLKNDEIDSFRQLIFSIVKFELLQKLLITVISEQFVDSPSVNLDLLKIEIYKFIIDFYCANDYETKLWSMKSIVTDTQLASILAGIIENPLDYIFKSMVPHDHEQLLIYFDRFNLDKNAYQLWSYTKKLGHVVGFNLPGKLMVNLSVQGRDMGNLELTPDRSTDSVNGLNWTIDILNNFLLNNANENELNILDDVDSLLRSYKYTSYANNNYELLTYYDNGMAISIPGGWHGHGVGLALYKNLLIYCNRGKSAGFENHSGIHIYKLKLKATIDTLTSLRKFHLNPEDFTKFLNQIVTDVKDPMAIMPLKPQNRGNCVFANSKGLMKGLLFCFEFKRTTNVQSSAVYAHTVYKKITSDMRDTMMFDLAATINFVTENHKQIFITILSLLIIEHHSKPQQQDRIYKSLNILSRRELKIVLDAISKYQFKKELDADFINLLHIYTEQRKSANYSNSKIFWSKIPRTQSPS
jgi:hypothetical protein